MVLPTILPNDYSRLSEGEIEIAEIAVRSVKKEWGFLFYRFSVINVTKKDSKWEVELIEHGLFNVPVIKASCVVSPDMYYAESCRFEKIGPYAFWLLLLSYLIAKLITILIRFLPFILFIYIFKKINISFEK